MKILERLDSLYHAAYGLMPFSERAVKEQDALADLRGHTGFLTLIDVFEGELRQIWREWLLTTDKEQIIALQSRARTVADMLRLIDRQTTAKERAENAEAESQRQADLSRVDAVRQQQAIASRPRFRNHANVNS